MFGPFDQQGHFCLAKICFHHLRAAMRPSGTQDTSSGCWLLTKMPQCFLNKYIRLECVSSQINVAASMSCVEKNEALPTSTNCLWKLGKTRYRTMKLILIMDYLVQNKTKVPLLYLQLCFVQFLRFYVCIIPVGYNV